MVKLLGKKELREKVIKHFKFIKEEISEKGYSELKGVFTAKTIKSIISEVNKGSEVDKYFDRNQNERRIERLYDKGYNLSRVNRKILKILELIYGFEWKIFKDKFNSKPPGGEGFYSHFDGVFIFTDKDGEERNGWYTYANQFVSVLVAIDDFTPDNGPIELSPEVKGTFQEILEFTKKDGTPNLTESYENQCIFENFFPKIGDIIIFNANCPHRSDINHSKSPRRTLYYSYNPSSQGDHYKKYFEDKHSSRNSNSKSLTGDI